MGRQGDRQSELMVMWSEMPRSPGHVFYDRLQAVLLGAGFDGFVEEACRAFYAAAVLVSRAAKARLTAVPEPDEAADIDLGYLRLYDSALLPNDLLGAKSGSATAISRAQPTVHEPELACPERACDEDRAVPDAARGVVLDHLEEGRPQPTGLSSRQPVSSSDHVL